MYCHRYMKPNLKGGAVFSGNEVTLADGRRFVFIGETPDGFGKFRDFSSWENQQAWEKKQNVYGAKRPQKTQRDTLNAQAAVAKPQAAGRMSEHFAQKKLVQTKSVGYLDRVYSKMLSLLLLEDEDKEELSWHDEWSEKMLQAVLAKYPLRSLPPTDRDRFDRGNQRKNEFFRLKNISRKKLITELEETFGENGLSGVPGFYPKKNGEWTVAGMDGYLIPQYNVEGKMYRLRIRTHQSAREAAASRKLEKLDSDKKQQIAESIDVPITDTEALREKICQGMGKYVAFSSPNCDGGCESGSQLSFYGLDYLKSRYPKLPIKRVIVCEGEKKGIVASLKLGYLVITLPGVGTYRLLSQPLQVSDEWIGPVPTCLEWLRSIGIQRIAVANDADMISNALVRNATVGTLRMVSENGFVPEFACWDTAFGKGIDNCLIHEGKVIIQKVEGL